MKVAKYRLQSLIISMAVVVLCFGQVLVAEGRERREEVVRGPMGNTAAEGPRGNVAVGQRYNVLPSSARAVIVDDQTYYVDDDGVYYLSCDDDDTVYCVVPAPQDD
ncbi:MAG: hypothetical protein AB7U29_14265 [Desulfobulbus sp.]